MSCKSMLSGLKLKDTVLNSFKVWYVFMAQLPSEIEFGGPFGAVSASDPGGVLDGLATFLFRLAIFLGVIFIVLNGIKLISAGGDSNKIKDAYGGIKDAILGMMLAALAASVVKMIDSWL